MKRTLLFVIAVLVSTVVVPVMAENIDMATAQRVAMDFVCSHNATGSIKSSMPRQLWSHAEPSAAVAGDVAYFIVSTDRGFVVVAGDDRARAILAYSDSPLTDINDLPTGARFWLDLYKRQIEELQSQPEMKVTSDRLRSSWYHPAESITPMLRSVWSQGSPFNRQCPTIDGSYCYVGCSAVALAQVMRYWQYPAQCDSLPSYISSSLELPVPALEGTSFDWSNMLDNYPVLGGYSQVQLNAVSTLLRYVGQAESMDYKLQGSDADEYDILNAIQFFGYDKAACFVSKSSIEGEEYYADNIWSAMLWNELKMGRPVIYCAYALDDDSISQIGHAFNVDGYNATDDTYHVNFGWRGSGDGYYALNAFLLADYRFDIGQLMFLNVMPPRPEPVLWANNEEVDMTCHVGDTVTQRIVVAGSDLVSGITATLDDPDEAFTMTITQDLGSALVITLTFAPNQSGSHSASLIFRSLDAQDVVVAIHGSASLRVETPVLLPADSAAVDTTSFRADWIDGTSPELVEQYVLEVASTDEFDPADSCYVVITGITDTTCVVDSLVAGSTYYYRVRAVYVDGTVGEWSNVEVVTLLEPEQPLHEYELGDVNHDGVADIIDLTCLIDYLLNPGVEICPICADVLPDGVIDINDLTALIDLLLNGPS